MATELYDSAKAAGARIHSDSWGGNTPAYDSMVHQVDQYAWENLKFLPMFAAGNEGDDLLDHAEKRFSNYTDGRYTLGNPANAKNCMSIGAALSDNSEPIDNSWLATRLGDKGIWDSKTDWTWQKGIGGSEGVHWSHLLSHLRTRVRRMRCMFVSTSTQNSKARACKKTHARTRTRSAEDSQTLPPQRRD